MQTIRVKAVGDARLPVPGTPGRFVGRDRKTGEILADGVTVPAESYYLRAVARGDLALLESAEEVQS
jgi:hypothetical protein